MTSASPAALRAAAVPILVTVAAAAAALIEWAAPFAPYTHGWPTALAASAACAYLLFSAGRVILAGGGSRAAGLAALGGALLAGSVAYCGFLVGQPQRAPAAPGQLYRPPGGGSAAVRFPDANPSVEPGTVPPAVIIYSGTSQVQAAPGDTVRAGAYVFRVAAGPIACVDARGPRGARVTITQPDGPAFLSPCLTFIGMDGDKPEDEFALPALHRVVQVDYWPGLPSRGIDVPFLVIRIAEQNGGALFEGVAVSGRALRKAGAALTFELGSYPVVTVSTAPPAFALWAGFAMAGAGALAAAARRGVK